MSLGSWATSRPEPSPPGRPSASGPCWRPSWRSPGYPAQVASLAGCVHDPPRCRCSASAKACSASARSARNRLGCQPTRCWHAKASLVAAGGIAGVILATLAGMPRAGPGRRVGSVAASMAVAGRSAVAGRGLGCLPVRWRSCRRVPGIVVASGFPEPTRASQRGRAAWRGVRLAGTSLSLSITIWRLVRLGRPRGDPGLAAPGSW
jgi:hypothetical protein